MKRLIFVTIITAIGFAASAQTKPQRAAAKKTVQIKTVAKKESCKSGMSCCKNEKALSALRRPSKPVTAKKS